MVKLRAKMADITAWRGLAEPFSRRESVPRGRVPGAEASLPERLPLASWLNLRYT